MDDDRRALLRGLAELAGYDTSDRAMDQVIRRADRLSRDELNSIWRRNKVAPHTLASLDRLAMTLRFVETARESASRERGGLGL